MPQGDKSSYTDRQKRKAAHIEQGYEDRGVPRDEAEARAWATVNKSEGGGRKSGSGRARPAAGSSPRKDAAPAARTPADRSAAARKGWETRRRKAG